MRLLLSAVVVSLFACGPDRGDRDIDAGNTDPTMCTGLECSVVQCEKMGMPPTTVSGTVFAPNGTLALYGANVYVPFVDPGPFEEGASWQSLGLKGDETVTIRGLQGELKPRQKLIADIVSADGSLRRVPLLCRIDTLDELDYYRNGGILHYVLRKLAA